MNSGTEQVTLQRPASEATLHRLAELASEFGAEYIAATARSVAERVSEGRFYVACVGQFKRGKSTLLNALVGHSVLPTGVVPVTAVPTIIRYGERLAARVRFQTEEWTEIPVDELRQYVSEEKNPENAKRVAGLEIFAPTALLASGMCLVDTPGLGSVHVGNTAAIHALIPHIDAAIVVIGADPPLSGDELRLVESVAQEVHELVFVLNKADRVSENELATAKEFAQRVLAKRLGRSVPNIFEVSALEQVEDRGRDRDWREFLLALKILVEHSGFSLVRKATERGTRRAASQLLAVLFEERNALQRPLEESRQRIVELRKILDEAEHALKDFGYLLAAEQQRLSATFAERRNAFLKEAIVEIHKELPKRLTLVPISRNGPAYRRGVMHEVQAIVHARLEPCFENEGQYAEQAFGKIARRFIELGNDFLRRFSKTAVSDLNQLPEELDASQGLCTESKFSFHVIERVAAPSSPLLFVADLVMGALGLRSTILRDAEEFATMLLEVNTGRVQSDVDERVRDSRQKLEADIRGALREASAIAERALERAQKAQEVGVSAVEEALERIDAAEHEVRMLLSISDTSDNRNRT